MVKRKGKAAKKSIKRVGKKRVAKKTAKKKSYNPHTGRATGRAIGGLERRDKLAEEYMAQGMSPEDARSRAIAEMRDNPRRDWRLKTGA
jgi:hypothetical protein